MKKVFSSIGKWFNEFLGVVTRIEKHLAFYTRFLEHEDERRKTALSLLQEYAFLEVKLLSNLPRKTVDHRIHLHAVQPVMSKRIAVGDGRCTEYYFDNADGWFCDGIEIRLKDAPAAMYISDVRFGNRILGPEADFRSLRIDLQASGMKWDIGLRLTVRVTNSHVMER